MWAHARERYARIWVRGAALQGQGRTARGSYTAAGQRTSPVRSESCATRHGRECERIANHERSAHRTVCRQHRTSTDCTMSAPRARTSQTARSTCPAPFRHPAAFGLTASGPATRGHERELNAPRPYNGPRGSSQQRASRSTARRSTPQPGRSSSCVTPPSCASPAQPPTARRSSLSEDVPARRTR